MRDGLTLLLVLELAGTFVFGLNGALTAMEAEELDLVGVVVLGTMTALGGGITRDILIGELPPASFSDWRYLAMATLSSVLAFISLRVLTRPLPRALRLINVFDAAGLALFCVTGTTVALAAGLEPFQATLLGSDHRRRGRHHPRRRHPSSSHRAHQRPVRRSGPRRRGADRGSVHERLPHRRRCRRGSAHLLRHPAHRCPIRPAPAPFPHGRRSGPRTPGALAP